MYFTQSRHHTVSVAHELFLFLKELRVGQNRLRVTAESDAADSCSDSRPIHCSLRNPTVCLCVCSHVYVHIHHMSLPLPIPILINIFNITEGCFHTLKPSGYYMYRTVVTICTASLTFSNSTFCPHSCIYVFCVDL
jgi:hypothetical protein